MRPLDPCQPRRILVRGTNWVGDAVMSLPALEALDRACPWARITVLAKPAVAPVYGALPGVDVLAYQDPGPHSGWGGLLALSKELKREGFDWAVLLQNAFEAAFLTWLAQIPLRVGFNSDARGLLLTHSVKRLEEHRRVHETSYYLHMLHGAGLYPQAPPDQGVLPPLKVSRRGSVWAAAWWSQKGLGGKGRVLALAPGAAYGPAKCYPALRYAAAARELCRELCSAVILLGGSGERDVCAQVEEGLAGLEVLNLAGATSLDQALGVLARAACLLTNDSGLMHAAAALGTPTVAIFGSTDPQTTAPLGPWVNLVREPVSCAPCKRTHCPTDLRCFTAIPPERVALEARELIREREAMA